MNDAWARAMWWTTWLDVIALGLLAGVVTSDLLTGSARSPGVSVAGLVATIAAMASRLRWPSRTARSRDARP